jgi:hypothetical protein
VPPPTRAAGGRASRKATNITEVPAASAAIQNPEINEPRSSNAATSRNITSANKKCPTQRSIWCRPAPTSSA